MTGETSETAAHDGNGASGEAPGSPLAGLRERLAQKQVKTTVDIAVPAALEDELAVRYHALGWDKEQEIEGRNDSRFDSYMDALINACDCVLYRQDGKWLELREQGSKVRFDRRLANALGIPWGGEGGQQVDTRVVLRGVFAIAAGGKGQPPEGVTPDELWEQALQRADHLIDMHHTEFMVWLKGGEQVGIGAEEQIEQDLLGE